MIPIKMMRSLLCWILAILAAVNVYCAPPPNVTDSYIAWGEITQPVKDMDGIEAHIMFEETYDDNTKNAVFVAWIMSENVTFVKNFKTNQTFKYTKDDDLSVVCELIEETEWVKSDYPPGLLAYEDNNGTVKFSLRQLFNIPEKFLLKDKQGVKAIYRGVPAKLWMYEIPGNDDKGRRKKMNIYSYWSDGTWITSSNAESVPLGFIISKMMYYTKNVKVAETVTNVFGYVTGTFHRKLLEPFQGVICPNRAQTLKFPNLQDLKAISFHSEMVLPEYQEIKYIDTWFDPKNQLLRRDMSRLRDEGPIAERKEKRYASEIAIGKMGVVLRQTVFKDQFTCEAISFKKYQNEMQNFIDVKQDLSKWKMGKLFGLNDTTYVYTGKTTKADIPCHVFQGVRKDWPEVSANVTSLWEWCFNINMTKENDVVTFGNNEVGLINAQVTILTSGSPQEYPPKFRMFHHFYEVSSRDPAVLDATSFDISRCFSETQTRALQFQLDWPVTDDNKHIAENLTSDVNFLMMWKAAIYEHTNLPSYSLRIAKLRSTIDDQKIYIKFLILLEDTKLYDGVWGNQITALQAQNKLRDNTDAEKVSIKYILKKGQAPTEFKAAKNSVTYQINPDVYPVPYTFQPDVTTGTPTLPPFSLKTPEPDENSTKPDEGTTVDPEKVKEVHTKTGHQPGTVAAVSVGMLLVGISIGSIGTFYKFNGLPSCMQR